MANPSPGQAYDSGYRNGGRSAESGTLHWADGRPEATPEAIRQDGIRCLAVAIGEPWQDLPIDRVLAMPEVEGLLAEFGRGWADGLAGEAASAEQVAADPQWRGWAAGGNPCYRP